MAQFIGGAGNAFQTNKNGYRVNPDGSRRLDGQGRTMSILNNQVFKGGVLQAGKRLVGNRIMSKPSPTVAPVAPVTQAAATHAAPTTMTLNEADTSSGRLNAMLQKGSPLMTLARTGALQAANARGLANSSMAAGAGEVAAIGSAQPFALQDSNLFQRQQLTNQDAINKANLFNAGADTEAAMFNAGASNTNALSEFNANAALKRDQMNNSSARARDAAQNAAALERVNANNTSSLARDAAQNAAALQRTKISESNALTRAAMSAADNATQTYQTIWKSIQTMPSSEMPAAVKTKLLAQLDNLHQQRLAATNVLAGVTLNWAP